MNKRFVGLVGLLLLVMLAVAGIRTVATAEAGTSEAGGEVLGVVYGNAQTLAVQGNYACVGFENEFAIIDMTDKANPVEVSRLDIGTYIRKVEVHAQYAYVLWSSGTIEIFDISVATNPQSRGIYSEEGLISSRVIQDGLMYLATYTKFAVFDIADGENLVELSEYAIDDARLVSRLTFQGGYAYLQMSFDSLTPDRVMVFDISRSTQMHLETVFEPGGSPGRIKLIGDKLLGVYSGCSTICSTDFYVFILNKETWTTTIFSSYFEYYVGGAFALDANKIYAYAGSDGGMNVFNYLKREDNIFGSTLLIDSFKIGDVDEIDAYDDYVYVASRGSSAGAGGFYIVPAPPLNSLYLPIVDS